MLADPLVDTEDPTMRLGKLTCSGLMVMNGFALTILPVRVMPCCVEYPATPLVVYKFKAVD